MFFDHAFNLLLKCPPFFFTAFFLFSRKLSDKTFNLLVSKFQIPPDLVVKSQAFDIAEII
jgi:hypothetical protein